MSESVTIETHMYFGLAVLIAYGNVTELPFFGLDSDDERGESNALRRHNVN